MFHPRPPSQAAPTPAPSAPAQSPAGSHGQRAPARREAEEEEEEEEGAARLGTCRGSAASARVGGGRGSAQGSGAAAGGCGARAPPEPSATPAPRSQPGAQHPRHCGQRRALGAGAAATAPFPSRSRDSPGSLRAPSPLLHPIPGACRVPPAGQRLCWPMKHSWLDFIKQGGVPQIFAAGIPLFDGWEFVLPDRRTDRDIQHGGIKVGSRPPPAPRRGFRTSQGRQPLWMPVHAVSGTREIIHLRSPSLEVQYSLPWRCDIPCTVSCAFSWV